MGVDTERLPRSLQFYLARISKKMATRIRGNEGTRGRRAVQAKTAISSKPGATRNALGEIGNKNGRAVVEQEEKKLGFGMQKKAAVRAAPCIEVMDTDRNVVDVVKQEVEEKQETVFPVGVLDIDSVPEDQLNPQLCVEYASSIYAYLRGVEEGLSIRKEFLQGMNVSGKMRAVLIDWLIEVHSQFKLLQETLYMTVYVIDKFLQTEGYSIKRNKLQLVGVTAMFLASKVEEMYAPEINDFVYITDNAYTAGELRQMELRILNTLGFNFSRPLPLHFLRRNSKAGDVDVRQHSLAKYLVEMSLVEYSMVSIPPSLLASAALFLSVMILEPGATLASSWCPSLQHYSTYNMQSLLPVVCQLAGLLTCRTASRLQATHTKYRASKFLRVAEIEDLDGNIVQKLAVGNLTDL